MYMQPREIEIEMYADTIVLREYVGKQRKIFVDIAESMNLCVDYLIGGEICIRYNDNKAWLYEFLYKLSKEFDLKVV